MNHTSRLGATLGLMGLLLVGIGSVQAAQPQNSTGSTPTQASQYREVLNRYCVTCHNGKLKTAGLMLDQMDLAKIPTEAEVWEKVIRKLRGRAMPPPKKPRPDDAT